MKSAYDWADLMAGSLFEERADICEQIQREAYKAGMIKAAEIAGEVKALGDYKTGDKIQTAILSSAEQLN